MNPTDPPRCRTRHRIMTRFTLRAADVHMRAVIAADHAAERAETVPGMLACLVMAAAAAACALRLLAVMLVLAVADVPGCQRGAL